MQSARPAAWVLVALLVTAGLAAADAGAGAATSADASVAAGGTTTTVAASSGGSGAGSGSSSPSPEAEPVPTSPPPEDAPPAGTEPAPPPPTAQPTPPSGEPAPRHDRRERPHDGPRDGPGGMGMDGDLQLTIRGLQKEFFEKFKVWKREQRQAYWDEARAIRAELRLAIQDVRLSYEAKVDAWDARCAEVPEAEQDDCDAERRAMNREANRLLRRAHERAQDAKEDLRQRYHQMVQDHMEEQLEAMRDAIEDAVMEMRFRAGGDVGFGYGPGSPPMVHREPGPRHAPPPPPPDGQARCDPSGRCWPPPACEGRVGQGPECTPPPDCQPNGDGSHQCTPRGREARPYQGVVVARCEVGQRCPLPAGEVRPHEMYDPGLYGPRCDPSGRCAPPPACEGRVGQSPECTPPPYCPPNGDGSYQCAPREYHYEYRASTDSQPRCDPSGRCAPPPACADRMGQGTECTPPPQCAPNGDGTYQCGPPPAHAEPAYPDQQPAPAGGSGASS